MVHYIEDIKSRGVRSGVAHAPFDEALEILRDHGESIISIARNAQLRIQEGKDAYVCRYGHFVKEGVIYAPNRTPRLVKISPILASAKEATEACRQKKEFYPTQDALEVALRDSVEFPQEHAVIPVRRFNSDALTVFTFGGEKEARAYGDFLEQIGTREMLVCIVDKSYVDEQPKPFVRQLLFDNPRESAFVSNYPYLHQEHEAVRGVRE